MIETSIGYRRYEFNSVQDAEQARIMFNGFVGSQNEFEDELENQQIEFLYVLGDTSWK